MQRHVKRRILFDLRYKRFCLTCDIKAENSSICDQNAYSLNDSSNNFPQPQYKNYLCNLYGNNSHDGYDYQLQFSFVYEQEPSYNQNYDDNYFPQDSPSFPCCDYCGGSHENYQCQPIAQNIDFFSYDQIQNPQYPEVQENSLTNDELEAFTNDNDAIMNDLQFKLDNLQKNQQKCEQMRDDFQNQMWNFMQNLHNGLLIPPPGKDKEPEATTDTELSSTEDIQPLPVQEPPQNSDMHQLIEECCVEASEEQKRSMEDTMLELVEICHHKEFLCIYDDVDDLIESSLDSKLLSINSQHVHNKEQKVKNVMEQPAEHGTRIEKSLLNFRVYHKSSISLNSTSQISLIHAVAPVLSTKEPEHLFSMRYEHHSITPETKSNEVTESNAENLLPILNKYEVTLEDKREYDFPIFEDIPVCDNYDIFFDSKIDDDISVYDDDFEDISQIQDVVLREKLLSITRLISNIESLNEKSTPDRVLNSFASDNSLLDCFSPEFKTFCDHSEETRSGNTAHANFSLLEYDSFRFEPDQERLINLVKNDILDDLSNDSLLEEADLLLDANNSIPPVIENVADDQEEDIHFLEALFIDDSVPHTEDESVDSIFEDNPIIPERLKFSCVGFLSGFQDLHILSLILDKEPEATMDTKLSSTEDIQPLPVQEPPQNSDMHQLIEECYVEASEEQKRSMEDTMLDALDSKLLSINSQRVHNKEQEVKNVMEQPAEHGTLVPVLSTKEPEHLFSMGYEHHSITPETESNEVTESNAENLLPILNKFYDDDFEDIEYVETSLPDSKIVSKEENVVEEEENGVHQEEEEIDFEDISQIQDVVIREKLLSITRLISPEFKTFCDHSEETRSGNTAHANYPLPEYDSFHFEPDQERLINLVKNDILDDLPNDPLLEEADLFLDADNSIPPVIENVTDDQEEDIHFIEALFIDDSVPHTEDESVDSIFEDNPSIP
nr:hypothetical protein [Tanacetum cinerariifolium]